VSLSAGQRLGPYEVVGPLGSGGMGAVLQPDGLMMAVRLADENAPPQSLFHLNGASDLDFDYDVARDGQRFLVRLTSEPEGAAGLRVALEWSEQLAPASAKR
jgi:hypothetical protein